MFRAVIEIISCRTVNGYNIEKIEIKNQHSNYLNVSTQSIDKSTYVELVYEVLPMNI
jgi:hypothetical protein